MKLFKNFDRTMLMGMRMMCGAVATRAEFSEMMAERRNHTC